MKVYIVYYNMQEYDDSDALDSIWTTADAACKRCAEMNGGGWSVFEVDVNDCDPENPWKCLL